MEDMNGLEIAVIGIGCQLPNAKNKQEYWKLLQAGKSGISHFSEQELMESGVPKEDLVNPNYVRAKGIIKQAEEFDPEYFDYTSIEANYLNPQHRVLLECANDALLDGGYSGNKANLRIGVYASASTNFYLNDIVNHQAKENPSQLILLNDNHFLATTISYKLNLCGPSMNIQTGCSSSLVAIHLACQALLSGDMDMGLAGGVSISLPNKSGYLYAPDTNHSPDGFCRALSKDAAGTVPSNGAGMVLLKRYEDAVEDNDHIYCVIKGSFVNNDGNKKQSYPAPSEEGQLDVIKNAFSISGVDPATISYIEAHGIGTLIGDAIEVGALTDYYRMYTKEPGFCAIGSVDSNIGHLDVASGVAKLIKVALMVQHKRLVKMPRFSEANKNISNDASPFYLLNQNREWCVNGGRLRATVSSFGVGGTNAFLILEEAHAKPSTEGTDSYHLMTISAHHSKSLRQLQSDLLQYIPALTEKQLIDTVQTYTIESTTFDNRQFYTFSDKASLIDQLMQSKSDLKKEYHLDHSPIVFLFSGQGAQYANLGSSLYKSLPVFKKYFDQCLHILRQEHNFNYFDYGSGEKSNAEDLLYSQISIFIYQYAMFYTLQEFGITPSLLIGHSLGEYVAACAAEVFTLKEAIYLVYHRAKLIQSTPDGKMVVVFKTEEEIQSYLSEHLSVASVNDQFSVTVSGTEDEMIRLMETLKKEGIAHIEIGTKKAIHSSVMKQIVEAYSNILQTVDFKKPNRKWVSAIEPGLAAEDVASCGYWINNLCNTVRFYDGICWIQNNCEKPLYIELGPGNALYSLLKIIQRKAVCFPVLRSDLSLNGSQSILNPTVQDEYLSFLNTIGLLWKNHVDIDLTRIYIGKSVSKVPMLPYPYRKILCRYDQKSVSVNRKGVQTAASTEQEKSILKIWQKVLKNNHIGIDDAFFEIGGNSLKLIELQVRLEQGGYAIDLDTLYKQNTIRKLAAHYLQEGAANALTSNSKEAIETEEYARNIYTIHRDFAGFNQFLYKNCFFSLLLSLLQSYDINPLVILSNDMLIYQSDDLLDIEYRSQDAIEHILMDAGVQVAKKDRVESIFLSLLEAIKLKHPVIISIDCFHEESRPDTYLQRHVTNMLLVYGYDPVQNTFSVIERMYLDTLSYENKTICAEEVVRCYEGYIDWFRKDTSNVLASYFEFDITDDKADDDYKTIYAGTFHRCHALVAERLNLLSEFKNTYSKIINNETVLAQNAERLIEKCNNIISAKAVEQYKLEHLNIFSCDENIESLLGDIISIWERIRNVIAKYFYSHVYAAASLQKTVGLIDTIYDKEVQILDILRKCNHN